MLGVPAIFARQLNSGVVLTQELSMKISKHEELLRDGAVLEKEIKRIREKQLRAEESLAEAMAEDDFRRFLSGQVINKEDDAQLFDVFKERLGQILNKLSISYERKFYLDLEVRKLRSTIEKDILKVNAQTSLKDSNDNR